ncbi:MAG: stalk domain-containing protein [Caldisericia bacterium]|nr:stalk domain-containing protein [Caldisericia bacterium]
MNSLKGIVFFLCIFLTCSLSISPTFSVKMQEPVTKVNDTMQNDETISFGTFGKPIAIAQYDREIFVLDEEYQTIQIFQEDLQLIETLSILAETELSVATPRDIVVLNNRIFILDIDQHCIIVLNRSGEYLYTIGEYGTDLGQFVFPQAICSFDDKLVVADAGNARVQILDLLGNPIFSFGKQGTSEEDFLLIKGIYATHDKVYVSDAGNHKVVVFSHDGQFIESYGEKGHERGKLLHPQGLAVDALGNIIVADTGNDRIQKINVFNLQCSVYRGNVLGNVTGFDKDHTKEQISKGLSSPSDMVLCGDSIFLADTAHQKCKKIPVQLLFHKDTILVSQNVLDFGSIGPNEKCTHTLSVRDIWRPTFEGIVAFNKDFVDVDPVHLQSFSNEVRITVDGKNLEQGKVYMETLSISCMDDEIINIPMVFRASTDEDFSVEPTGIHCIETEQWNEIPVQIRPLNGFEGEVSFSADTVPDFVKIRFEPPRIDVKKNSHTIAFVSSLTPLPENTKIPIQIDCKGSNGKAHSAQISLMVRNAKYLTPTTVLGELFTATWCLGCIYSHMSMMRIMNLLGPDYASFVSYYVDSTTDHPVPRLSWIESEQRMKCYMSDKGLPTIFFGGTDYLKGVSTDNSTPEGKKERMYKDYIAKVFEKSSMPSPIRIQSKQIFDGEKRIGKIHASVQAFENLPFKDPRLQIAFIESNIQYSAVNGDDFHHFVLRDFITADNDDEDDYLGTPMILPSGETFGKKGDTFNLEVDFSLIDFFDPDNISIVVFVQDNSTKKVLQSSTYPLKTQEYLSFDIASNGSLVQTNTKGETGSIEFDVINSGNVRDEFTISISNESSDRWDYSVTTNGVEETGSTIFINPCDRASVQIDYTVPAHAAVDASQEFFIQVESLKASHTKEFTGSIRVKETLPPGFLLDIEEPEDLNIMAGYESTIGIRVTPDPHVENNVELTLLNPPDELASYQFTPPSGPAPLESVLTFAFADTTAEKEFDLVIQAKAGTIIKTAIVTIHVLRNPDATPPELHISVPSDNLLTNNPNLTITGRTDATAILTINDAPVEVTNNGSFEHLVVLAEGFNTIDVIATNRKGQTTQKTLTVQLDVTPPVLTIETEIPEETTKREITVVGRTEPNCVVTIGEQDILLEEDGRFTSTVKLVHGWNSIFITSMDKASNKTTIEYRITVIHQIVLQIGNLKASVNDEEVILDAPPYIKNGRTMVPFRFISESFGAHVIYDAVERSITLYTDDVSIWLQIGNSEAFIEYEGVMGREKVILEAPPEIVNNRTFVPLRFIGEAFGASVDWNGETRKITITK